MGGRGGGGGWGGDELSEVRRGCHLIKEIYD